MKRDSFGERLLLVAGSWRAARGVRLLRRRLWPGFFVGGGVGGGWGGGWVGGGGGGAATRWDGAVWTVSGWVVVVVVAVPGTGSQVVVPVIW